MEQLIVNLETGEVAFGSVATGNDIVVNCVEVDEDEAEVKLYKNASKGSPYYFVMETDLISDDFMNTEKEPVKYALVL